MSRSLRPYIFPDLLDGVAHKLLTHRAMDDIHESITEYRHYLQGWCWTSPTSYRAGAIL
ncbi:hypothetical protein [Saccharopolyspora pogona]|uniref:hypothetical protein n=1 Tax=Saccharopolyspora pogona TaxID=333966 RepID=UPI00168A3BD8|nr:hypothetical protein [Saccharopolyspora pogona]